jgi:HlyD family secretion protein
MQSSERRTGPLGERKQERQSQEVAHSSSRYLDYFTLMDEDRKGNGIHDRSTQGGLLPQHFSPSPFRGGGRGKGSGVAATKPLSPNPSPRRGGRGVNRRLRFGLVLTVFAALTGCSKTSTTSGSATTTPGSTFTFVHPQRKALPKVIVQPGTVQPYEAAPLFAKLAGFVKTVNVDIGDPVEGPSPASGSHPARAGTVLAELRIPELEDEGRQKDALVEQATAEVEQAKKLVEVADANVVAADAHIVESKAGVRRAQATFKYWESQASRVAEMVRNKSIGLQEGAETENQFRAAEAGREEAQARVTVAEKAAVKARAELGKAGEDVKAAAAKRKVAEAEAARLRSLLDYRFIRAPFPGVVTRRNVDTGHFVHPAGAGKSESLFTVVRLDTVRVRVDVPDADAALVTKGTKAKVRIPALNADFAGEVNRTSEALEAGSLTLRVEIDLPNADRKLRPGLFVTTQITAAMPEAWVLPVNSVVKQADQTVVFLHLDGKAVRLPIQPGRSDGTWTEVKRKQKAGAPGVWEEWTGSESVISGPAATLTDGQEISVK